MPAKNLNRVDEDGIYSHIYNKGVEQRFLFNDEEDYQVFLGFLKDYLSTPKDPESTKQTFQVHGRSFRGTPHQPKNYHNRIELISYSLRPDHFHLLVHQVIRGSLESFIRSLCTRYSIYFNKKYSHTGSVFEGPYKYVQIKDQAHLPALTRFLHHAGVYSSFADYLGVRTSSWVNSSLVLSIYGKGADSYKEYVDNYESGQYDRQLTENISFESPEEHFEEKKVVKEVVAEVETPVLETPTVPVEAPVIFTEQVVFYLKPWQRLPEVLAVVVVFSLLVAIGATNIVFSKTTDESSQPAVLGIKSVLSTIKTTVTPQPSSTPEVAPKAAVVIKAEPVKPEPVGPAQPKLVLTVLTDEAEGVNIRSLPTTNSEKLGKAKDGETFEFTSKEAGWYEIKLTEGSIGYISEKYVEEGVEN